MNFARKEQEFRMTAAVDPAFDWQPWYRLWEARMHSFVPDRPTIIRLVLDVLAEYLGEAFLALEAGSGPGSLAAPLVERFPRAVCLATDLDPVLLAMGRSVHAGAGDRLRWLSADLRRDRWVAGVHEAVADRTERPAGDAPLDAVVTMSALHHLSSSDLVETYRRLAGLLRPGGVLLNADFLPFPAADAGIQRLCETITTRRRDAFEVSGGDTAPDFWDRLRAEPALAALFAERDRHFPPGQPFPPKPSRDLHLAAARDAGFAHPVIVWQALDKGVLLAVR